ncbi:MAG TPA: zf-TFIIB domain-containing protein [Candidatus Saccharimonadales bacterium]|jgi:Zn-finger nucleic acid-binding protein|nr:zf-TFIIB domain-containing protein [Candidatus Saccharimonadales bacterium]
MYGNGTQSSWNLYLSLALAAFILGTIIWRKYSIGGLLSRGSAESEVTNLSDASAIISYYTAGHSLTNAQKGRLNGQHYSVLVTTPIEENHAAHDISFTNETSLIYTLDLPFNTEVHLVGLSKKYKIDVFKFETFLLANNMEKIQLEGDFSDYYALYGAKGQQFQARYVLDLAAMEFVVDYCRNNFWEINSSELYFVIASDQQGENIIEEGQKFTEQIKPALLPGESGAPTVKHEAAYGEYDGPPLKCPLCQQTMVMSDENSTQACPGGHGILLNAKDLRGLRHREFTFQADPTKTQKHDPLVCPNCKNPMIEVDFEDSGVIIDSCEHCPFRWLDANEISEIASGQKILNPALQP